MVTNKPNPIRTILHRLHSPATRTFSTLVLIVGSIVSKAFGIIRQFSMAAIFGTSADTDSWLMASIVPNLLYGLLSQTLTNVVVPVLSGRVETVDQSERTDIYINEVFTWTLVLSVVLAAIGEILSSHLIHWVAPGFTGTRYRLAVSMVRIMLPTMPFMALGSLINGILQANRIFTPSTISPIIINVGRVAGIVVLGLWLGIRGVAYGFLAAQALQLVYLLPTLWAQHIYLRFRFRFSHPWTRQSGRLALPFIASHGANVGGIMVDRIFASLLPVGRIAALNYSNVLSTLPITLLINPVISPLYTQLSQSFNRDNRAAFRASLQSGFELITLIIMPLALAFIMLRVPIIRILYQHGRFDTHSTNVTSHLLLFWSIGLPAIALGSLFSRALFAQRLTRVTAWMSIMGIGANVAGDFLFIHPLGASGLALATSLAAWCRAIGLGAWLFSRGENRVSPRMKFVAVEAAALALYAGILFLGVGQLRLALSPFGLMLFMKTAATAGVAMTVYVGLLRWAGVMPALRRRAQPVSD